MRRFQIQSGGEAQAACLHGSATQEAAGLHAGVGVKSSGHRAQRGCNTRPAGREDIK